MDNFHAFLLLTLSWYYFVLLSRKGLSSLLLGITWIKKILFIVKLSRRSNFSDILPTNLILWCQLQRNQYWSVAVHLFFLAAVVETKFGKNQDFFLIRLVPPSFFCHKDMCKFDSKFSRDCVYKVTLRLCQTTTTEN